jgi:PadR family transcriptional regulator, regulatory protein PadR
LTYIEFLVRLYSVALLPRITTQVLSVLSAMLGDPDADWYGFDLCKKSGLKPGTIYPILDRLLKVGWLERRWEDIDPSTEGRPKRRLYRLTGVGASSARMAIDEHLASLHNAESAGRLVRPQPSPRIV